MSIALPLHRAALVLVDLQRDFLHPDGFWARRGWPVPSEADVAALIERCQRLVQAMHARQRPVVFVKTALRADHADCALPPPLIRRGLDAASGALVDGSWGAELMDGLRPEPEDYVIVKPGYSAFQHTCLDRLLTNLRIDHCIVAGGSVAGPLSDTLRQGAALGYEQLLVQDALYPVNSPDLVRVMNRAALVSSEEIATLPPSSTPDQLGEAPEYALLVVDIQNDFVHPDGATLRYGYSQLSDADRERMLANNCALARAMRAKGWPVIFVRDVQTRHGRDTVLGPMMRRRRPMPAEAQFIVEGTWGADFVEGLDRAAGDIEIVKRGNSAFGFTHLHRTLRNLRVRHCLVTGGEIVGCISDTVREGVGLGYEMSIISDATFPPDSPYLRVLAELGEVRSTSSVLEELGPAEAGGPDDPAHQPSP